MLVYLVAAVELWLGNIQSSTLPPDAAGTKASVCLRLMPLLSATAKTTSALGVKP